MIEPRPANPLEMIAYVLAQQIEDGEVVYIGTGLPWLRGLWQRRPSSKYYSCI